MKVKSDFKNIIFKLSLFIMFILLVTCDQVTKIWVMNNLSDGREIKVIGNAFTIKYLTNYGAAFGILQNKRLFFCILTALFIVFFLFLIILIPTLKKYYLLLISSILLISGALGNLIDRFTLSYVRDFLYFKLINFPIFNLADIYVCVGCFLLMIYVLFLSGENDLNELFIILKKKFINNKKEDIKKHE